MNHNNTKVSCSVSSTPDLGWHGSMDEIVLWSHGEENENRVWKLEEKLCGRLSGTLIGFAAWGGKQSDRSAGSTAAAAGDWRFRGKRRSSGWSRRPSRGLNGWKICLVARKVQESEARGGIRDGGWSEGWLGARKGSGWGAQLKISVCLQTQVNST